MANEKRLIDANELDSKLDALAKKYAAQGRFEAAKDYSFIQTVLLSAPTVDAVEVVHASWIEDGYYGNPFVCSHCGSEGCYSGDFGNKQYYYTNYCPNCGAKMDGDGNAER